MVTKRMVRTQPGERVERRSEPRLTTNMQVMVTVLGDVKQPPVAARVEDMSGKGLRFRVQQPIDCGAAVKVEGNDMLLLGEVCRSQPALDGYQVVIQISHSLAALTDLEHLNRALLGWNPALDLVGSVVTDHAA